MDDITVDGEYPIVERLSTGIYSLDVALKGGLPLRCLHEVYGYEHVGKSTFCYYLAGKVSQEAGEISVCDIEFLDKDYLKSAVGMGGFRGAVHLIGTQKKGKISSHEDMLEEMINSVRDKETVASGILDSIGALVPIAESEGDLIDEQVGRRAKLVAKFVRKASWALVNKPKPAAVFVVNHVAAVIGGRGTQTIGGVSLKQLAISRINLWQKETIKSGDEIIGYAIAGTVEKLRFGGKGGKFQVINLAGRGIHPGLSAMFDCFEMGLAERGASVRMDDKSLGRIGTFFEAAQHDSRAKFEPFLEALDNHDYDNRMKCETDADTVHGED
jgi:RecA/RadA recombinase